ncbi:MAG: ferredoxin--NADP reductase [Candidatus Scalindua sp.]
MEIKEFETGVIDVIQRTRDIKSFRFSVPQDINVDFKAGQYFVLTIKIKGQGAAKHFSFSNSPTEKGYVEFTKRITGSEFSQALDQLKKGDWAKLKMPYGFFTFEGEHEKIAFLSGGIGITCIRSMCKFVTDKKLPADIVLIYSNKIENDIVFREDFLQMQAENRKLKVVHTLTSPDIDTGIWKGRTGRIDSLMVKEEIPDYPDRVFYLCGPPKMVDALKSILSDELRLNKEKIKLEHFSGY